MTGPETAVGDAPLRIAMNHTRLAESGGVEAYVIRLVRWMLERGHRVDFFCAQRDASLEHPALRVVRVRTPRSPRALRVAAFARGSRRAIQRAEREQRYDVVHGFGRTCYQTFYRDGSGCFADYREGYLDAVKRRGVRGLERLAPTDLVVQSIERARYRTSPPRLVVAISRRVREQILRRYALPPERVRVLYSGIDLDAHHPRLREAGRARLHTAVFEAPPQAPASGTRRVFVFAGNDYARKGLDVLIDALALLERVPDVARRDFAVAVVGRDRHEALWRRRAQQRGVERRLRFLGFRQDVPELLAGADALLLPSWFDAFGNVVAEALACGTPVVASARCGGSEWIRDGENGFVAARQDAESLARPLRSLLETTDLAPLRESARRSAEAWPWDAHCETLLALYREAAAAPR
jgi:UDP-glucose:(heptosyl)LPS alpha-1,3-glucosyltransferase